MKRLLSMLLALTLCLSLAACGSKDQSSGGEGTSQPQSETSSQNSGSTESKENSKNVEHPYEEFPELEGVVRVNQTAAEYCADAPSALVKRNRTSFKVETASYAVIYDQYLERSSDEYYDIDLKNITKAEDVLENMKKQTAACLESILHRADEYAVRIDSKENVTVNGWEMCKQKGAIELTHQFPLPYESADFVAYSLIKDGYPIYIMVIDKPDGTDRIDIEEMADKIAKTFREYED